MHSPELPTYRTLYEARKWGRDQFENHGFDTPELDSDLLLGHALKLTRTGLLSAHDRALTPEEIETFFLYVRRRLTYEPIAYIRNIKEFWSREFYVDPRVLIPRPETEHLIETVIESYGKTDTLSFIDVGTGSGCIAVTILKEFEKARGVGTDISKDALDVARTNAKKHDVLNRLILMESDLFAAVQNETFDLITANLPYVPDEDLVNSTKTSLVHEPGLALDGGKAGLVFLQKFIGEIKEHLNESGMAILEIGYDQKEAVTEIANSTGLYKRIDVVNDLAHHPRLLILG